MNDRIGITAGLLVFLTIVTSPIWMNLFGAAASPPQLEIPADQTTCVETKEYMAANHMQMLHAWRDSVVRDAKRTYASKSHRATYDMSLTKTCLKCHTSRDAFCNRCHTYVGVAPDCWTCHVAPEPERNDG